MAQFLKVLTGSKLLLLPFTAVAVVGVGSFYATYNASRWTSAKLLGVDHNNTSTVSQQPQHDPSNRLSPQACFSYPLILFLLATAAV